MTADVTEIEIWREELKPEVRGWLDEHDPGDLIGQCLRRLEILELSDLFQQYPKPSSILQTPYNP